MQNVKNGVLTLSVEVEIYTANRLKNVKINTTKQDEASSP